MIWGFVFGLETFTQKASGTLDFLIQGFRAFERHMCKQRQY